MELANKAKSAKTQSKFSRRNLLAGAAALTAATAAADDDSSEKSGNSGRVARVYIGTYTAGEGNGEGIYLGELNLSNGKLTIVKLVAPALPPSGGNASTASPSTLAIDRTGNYLYAGNEIFSPNGSVSAYKINRTTGDLTLLNAVPAVGAPAHVGLDRDRKYLFAAEYVGSAFQVFPIDANGSLLPAVQTIISPDPAGPTHATSAPPGSFAISAHEGPPHPHQMEADPSNKWVIGTDCAQDRIYVWKLTPGATPPLTPAAVPFVNVPPGDGPRHFAFHPNGRWMYSIQEEGDTIIFWMFDPANGSLTKAQQISSLPPGFGGTVFTSEIRVSPDGRTVYGVNRLHDTIGIFSIGGGGYLRLVDHVSTLGDYPRIITIDPSGRFMLSGNQRADNITSFRINPGNGDLTFTGDYTPVGSPSGIVFLP